MKTSLNLARFAAFCLAISALFAASARAGEATGASNKACCAGCCGTACKGASSAKFAPAGGGKAARQHAIAKSTKLAADKKVAAKGAACAEGACSAEVTEAKSEKGRNWQPRTVRHKQTMPAIPTLRDESASR